VVGYPGRFQRAFGACFEVGGISDLQMGGLVNDTKPQKGWKGQS
jgi:hypothetical protein